jgi:integrase/recombinase XerD
LKSYLEIGETEKLEDVAICLRDKLLIRILGRLGCRISEALGLEIKDIDFTRNTVTIEHLKSRINLSALSVVQSR